MAKETIQAMRERRNALAKETRNLLDKNTHAAWNDELQKKYDDNTAEIIRIDAAMEREQKLLDLEADRHFANLGGRDVDLDPNAMPARAAFRKVFDKLLRQGERAMTQDDWEVMRSNTMSTTTNSEGGYTVPTEVATSIIDSLKAFGALRAVATVIRTAAGNPMTFPTSDGTSEVGELVAQNDGPAAADIVFGTKSLDAYRYSSKAVTVPIELLQDSAVDIEAFIRARLSTRLGRITNAHFTTGTGSGQPNGAVTASAAGKAGATSATPAITYDDLVDLQESIDPAYTDAGNARWMMHQSTRKLIRKLKDDQSRPIWLPSYDAGIRGGSPEELLGAPIVLNQQMATPAASAKTVLFGDFTKYVIRDCMDMQLYRFTDSAYASNGQVGFLAMMRCDGELMDTAALKHFVHGAAS